VRGLVDLEAAAADAADAAVGVDVGVAEVAAVEVADELGVDG
jgi:hypothetical protein